MENKIHPGILMATDYSGVAFDAACYAIKLAAEWKWPLLFLHVYPPPTPAEIAFYEPAWQKDRVEYELWKIKDFVQRAIVATGYKPGTVHVQHMVTCGSVGEMILATAEKERTDLIVLGTHGKKNLSEVLMGNHAWHVSKKSKTPVLAIPAGSTYHEEKKIVFAVQGDEHEITAIDRFCDTFLTSQMQLHLLHISDRPNNIYEEAQFDRFCNLVKGKTKINDFKAVYRYNEQPSEAITTYCRETDADWLVMLPAKLNAIERFLHAFSSTSRKMSMHTRFPLFIVNT